MPHAALFVAAANQHFIFESKRIGCSLKTQQWDITDRESKNAECVRHGVLAVLLTSAPLLPVAAKEKDHRAKETAYSYLGIHTYTHIIQNM